VLILLISANNLVITNGYINQRQSLIASEKAIVFEVADLILNERDGPISSNDVWEKIDGNILILDQSQHPVYQKLNDHTLDDVMKMISDHIDSRDFVIDTRQIKDYTVYYFADFEQPKFIQRIIFINTFIGFTLIALVMYFRKNVYMPLKKLENIIHEAAQGEINYDFSQSVKVGSFTGIYADIQKLFIRMKDLILRETNIHLMKKQAELDALQSQINPHFLYNTLDVIRGQASEHHIKDIELMALSLSKMFRYSISNHDEFVSLDDELENIDCYLTIQNVRFNNKLLCQKNIDEDTLQCKIPKLIIQPIVENAIYHGLEQKLGSGKLTIRSYRTRSRLMISIHDNGLGIKPERLAEINETLSAQNAGSRLISKSGTRFSIGLSNVNSRIKLLFGNEFGLVIYSSEGYGTTVQMNLPVNET
jgi:two-component system sensor histidine kinase YesM